MARRAPLSHSAQPQHRAQSLEVRKDGGEEVEWGEGVGWGGKDSREEERWASGGKWKETGGWTDRVEEKNSTRSLLLNTVEQYCNICSFQLQQTFINSIWLLSYFTPKVSSKSIHSEGTVMVSIMSGCVWREIGQNQAQLSVLSVVVSVFSNYSRLYLCFTDNHWQVADKSTNL